jgi:hypothetical protein
VLNRAQRRTLAQLTERLERLAEEIAAGSGTATTT